MHRLLDMIIIWVCLRLEKAIRHIGVFKKLEQHDWKWSYYVLNCQSMLKVIYLSWTFQNCSSFKFQFIWKNGVQVGLLDNGINRLSFFGEWKEINENELFSKQNNREVKFSRNLPTTGSMAGGFLEYPASLFSEHETCDKN